MMHRHTLALALAAVCAAPAHADSDLDAIRAEIERMKTQYESRIAALEERLKEAESRAATAAPESAPRDRLGEVSSGSAFNPRLSVILDGVYYSDNRKGEGAELYEEMDGIHHGHDHEGHDHGALERGFNLRETEIAFSATVDPYFDANLYLALDPDGGVSLEEGFFDTRMLPAGLKLRGGKFLSGIGYQNARHPHQWDFVDGNLAYRSLLGEHGLMDTGLQLTWLPPTGDLYTLLGVELLQGREQVFASAGESLPDDVADAGYGGLDDAKAGPRILTAFAKFAPDLGDNHALRLGVWGAQSRQHQEVHDHRDEDPAASVHALQGDAWLWGLDGVYKYDAPGPRGQGDFTLAAEYLRAGKDMDVAWHQTDPSQVGQSREFTQDGFYVQGVYGLAPAWQAGLRYDASGLTNRIRGDGGTTLADMEASRRWSLSLTHHFSEFARLRLQASTANLAVDGEKERVNQIFLQYQHSLGAHGAHGF